MPFLFAFMAALAVAAVYLALPDAWAFKPQMQVYETDPADYRFVAEHFWGIEHNRSSYHPDFRGAWGRFLAAVPFRDIAPGTAFLVVQALVGRHVYQVLPLLFIIAWCASYAAFFVVSRRQFGTQVAVTAFGLLLLPLQTWDMTQGLYTEPFLRPLFILLLTLLLWMREARDRAPAIALGVIGVIAVMVHVKVQWVLYGYLVSAALVVHFWTTRRRDAVLPVLIASACVPLSLLLVHGVGWGSAQITEGTGLHIMKLTEGASLTQACEDGAFEGYTPQFCVTGKVWFPTWGAFMQSLPATQGLARLQSDLDAQTFIFLLRHPYTVLERFWEGVTVTRSYVDVDLGPAAAAIDVLIACILACGLLHVRTRLLSVGALGLWIVPAVSNILALYDPRYHRPMQGIVLAIGGLVAIELSQTNVIPSLWRRILALCEDDEVRAQHA